MHSGRNVRRVAALVALGGMITGCELLLGAQEATLERAAAKGSGGEVTMATAVGVTTSTASASATGSGGAHASATASATTTAATTSAGTGGSGGGAATSNSTATTGTGGAEAAPNGSVCNVDNECLSGACVMGLCCQTACTDFGADKCVQNGQCKPDGSGCAYYPGGTPCANATCSGGVIATSACDGNGFCKMNQSTPCPGNYACADASTCKTICTANADCASAIYACSTINAGECLLAKGEPCTLGEQCASDGCANGHCQ